MARALRILSTVLLAVAVAQAGLGSGFGASLIARNKSEILEALHRGNAWVVIIVAVACVGASARYRQQGGPTWPLAFSVSLVLGGVLQATLGLLRVAGPHLFLGVLYLCAVTTFCSYAWRHRPTPRRATPDPIHSPDSSGP